MAIRGKRLPLAACVLGLFLGACAEKHEPFIAKVGNSTITQAQLDMTLAKAYGPNYRSIVSADARANALDSLVRMRALADAQLAKMDKQELAQLELEVERYREERLVETYLQEYKMGTPPSAAEVEAYYQSNIDRFTAPDSYHYEILQFNGVVDEQDLGEQLQKLSSQASRENWQQDSLPESLRHLQSSTATTPVSARVRNVLSRLSPGETSSLVYIDNAPKLFRLISKNDGERQSLASATREIQRALTVQSIKNSAKEASDQVLADIKVEYK
ncbi:peptidyl-prolyl cis-trans isomerase [Pseudoteredinibacter isoporae]|uniref:peptidyl-prolyl cis-trans isomerase n=1 Tax=Pseudoteredinibacter isoporae TaxID=570281 RepID=UPI00310968A1